MRADIIATGAGQLRAIFSSDVLPDVLKAYVSGLKIAFGLAVGMAGLGFAASLASPWRKIEMPVITENSMS